MTVLPSFFSGIVLAAALGALLVEVPAQDRDICRPGYARSQRLPPHQYYPIAQEAYRRAGIPWSERDGHRLDHILPLCLGGSWDQSNLQIQTTADAAAKDRIEVAACRAYCAGQISLNAARGRFQRSK